MEENRLEEKNKEYLTEKQAIELLKKYSTNQGSFQKVLSHSQAVKTLALEVATKIKEKHPKIKLDIDFIASASLVHDIGRFSCPPQSKESIKHGIKGAEILRSENLPKHASVAQNHLGAGITKQEIIERKLPLPKQDFVPNNLNEKIIAYADNRVFGSKIDSQERVITRFEREMPAGLPLLRKLNQEINNLIL